MPLKLSVSYKHDVMEAKAIIDAVLDFDQEKTVQLVQAHLDQGTDVLTILDQALIAAMDEVGRMGIGPR